MEKYIVKNKGKGNSSWLTRILGLWFWGKKKERAFRFKSERVALKIGKRETLDEEMKKLVNVISV